MAQASALERQRTVNLRPTKTQGRSARKAGSRRSRLLKAAAFATVVGGSAPNNLTPPTTQTPIGQTISTPEQEQAAKAQLAYQRKQAMEISNAYALPAQLNNFTDTFTPAEKAQVQSQYESQLEQGELDDMLEFKKRSGVTQRLQTITNQKIQELKKKAVREAQEFARAKMKEAVQKAGKETAKNTIQRLIWAVVDQGAPVDEGEAGFAWNIAGAFGASYQGAMRFVNGGKKLIPKGIISWIEPTPFPLPGDSQRQNKNGGSEEIAKFNLFVEMLYIFAWIEWIFQVLLALFIVIMLHVCFFVIFIGPVMSIGVLSQLAAFFGN